MWDSLRFDLDRRRAGTQLGARAFTALTVLALALGLGANSAVFAVVNGVLLKPLPYAAPDRLAMLWSENPRGAAETNPLSPANFDDLRRMSQSFEALDYALSFLVRVADRGTRGRGRAERDARRTDDARSARHAAAARAQHRPRRSRRGRASAIAPGARASAATPPSSAGGSSSAATKRSRSSAWPRRAFEFPLRDMLWQPTGTPTAGGGHVGADVLRGTALRRRRRRLRALVPRPDGRRPPAHRRDAAAADAEIRIHARTLAERYPDTNAGWGARVVGLHEQATGAGADGHGGAAGRRPAAAADGRRQRDQSGAGAVDRAAARAGRARRPRRQRPSARAAGAHREPAALRPGPGCCSTAVGYWMVRALVALAPSHRAASGRRERRRRRRFAGLDGTGAPHRRGAGHRAGLGGGARRRARRAAGRLARRGRRVAPRPPPAHDARRGRSGAGGRHHGAGRTALPQLRLAARHRSGVQGRPPADAADDDARPSHRRRGAARVLRAVVRARLGALPGVEAVGGTTRIPLGSSNVTTSVRAEGNTDAAGRTARKSSSARGSPDYFRAMGMPIVRGRGFLASDRPTDPPVVVINETMARLVFGERRSDRPPPPDRTRPGGAVAHGRRRRRRRAPHLARRRRRRPSST